VVQLLSSAGSLHGVQTPLTQSPAVLPMVHAVSEPVQAVEASMLPSIPPLPLPLSWPPLLLPVSPAMPLSMAPLLLPLELPLLEPLELPLELPLLEPLELPLLLPLLLPPSELPSSVASVLASLPGPVDDELLPPHPAVFAATAQPVRALAITHVLKELILCMITLPPMA
jgi:hypothetical protein